MHFDLLNAPDARELGRALIDSLYRGARALRLDARLMVSYEPRAGSVLVLYGMGGRDRHPHALRHLQDGGTLVCLDAGYWQRGLDPRRRKYRVSINGFHPPQYVMRGPDPGEARWLDAGLSIEDAGGYVKGPIMLVGNAPKSIAVGAGGWAQKKSQQIRATFPTRRIVYRPKPKRPHEPGVAFDALSVEPIDQALRTVSLVVCKHSNVAVDACRLGVPVVCDDGAAAAIYPSRLVDAGLQPSPALRREFLHRLAWWQWSPEEWEQGRAWVWLTETLGAL
jgi:hypothetical protein